MCESFVGVHVWFCWFGFLFWLIVKSGECLDRLRRALRCNWSVCVHAPFCLGGPPDSLRGISPRYRFAVMGLAHAKESTRGDSPNCLAGRVDRSNQCAGFSVQCCFPCYSVFNDFAASEFGGENVSEPTNLLCEFADTDFFYPPGHFSLVYVVLLANTHCVHLWCEQILYNFLQ